MEEKQAFFVESTDGRKCKMVIRGDLGKLSVSKVRRYLKSYGVPENQQLLAGNLVLEDDMLGEQFGLTNEAVLHLRDPASIESSQPLSAEPSEPPQQQQQQSSAAASPPHRLSNANRQSLQHPFPASQQTWREPLDDPAVQNTHQMEREIERLQRQLSVTEARNADLENQLLQATQTSAITPLRDRAHEARRMRDCSDVDGLLVAKESLRMLAEKLQVSLSFDKNLTCVLGTDEDFSILLTYDPATERLYLYSSLLTELPENIPLRMKLFEVLLEGSLLGREVCGGGIGLSTKNNVVVLTTSLPVRHCSPAALCDVVPVFVETLQRWRGLVDELLR
ncbi:hypothetical protein JKF63_03814 [Porcisia hertigi]|uniref:Ubiquitin-like domain-containing protein n=1 Tax=Porcisia hertigi TaxID=2761500 RepID=A0A836I6E1_9TRYP|nr:hypothetical protein JKF63_03814 [Porcisia hertigi]